MSRCFTAIFIFFITFCYAQVNKVYTLYYPSDGYVLASSQAYHLIMVAKENDTITKHIIVRSYTDSVGSIESNLVLSEKRATTVVDFLKSMLKQAQITYETFGESDPVSTDPAANRRTEIYVEEVKLQVTQPPQVESVVQRISTGYGGTKLSYDPSKITNVAVTEVFNTQQMLSNHMSAFDVNGAGLQSAGMLQINMKAMQDGSINVTMPSSNLDPDMKVYIGVEQKDGSVLWQETDIPFTIVNGAYVFTLPVQKGKPTLFANMDKKCPTILEFATDTFPVANARMNINGLSFQGIKNIDSTNMICFCGQKSQAFSSAIVEVNYFNDTAGFTAYSYPISSLAKTKDQQSFGIDIYALPKPQLHFTKVPQVITPNIIPEEPKKGKTKAPSSSKKKGFFKRLFGKKK